MPAPVIIVNPQCLECDEGCFRVDGCGCSALCTCSCESASYGQTSMICPSGYYPVLKAPYTCTCASPPVTLSECYDCLPDPDCAYCGFYVGDGDNTVYQDYSSTYNFDGRYIYTSSGYAYNVSGSVTVSVAAVPPSPYTPDPDNGGVPGCNCTASASGTVTIQATDAHGTVTNIPATYSFSSGASGYHSTLDYGNPALRDARYPVSCNAILQINFTNPINGLSYSVDYGEYAASTSSTGLTSAAPCLCPSGFVASGGDCIYTG